MNRIISILTIFFVIVSCGPVRSVPSVEKPQPMALNLQVTRSPRANTYVNLDYGIKLKAYDVRSKNNIVTKYDANPIFVPTATTYPSLLDFVSESTIRYMKELGFVLNADIETDFLLSLKLTEMNLGYFSNSGWVADVSSEIEVLDQTNRSVYPNVRVTGRFTKMAEPNDYNTANIALNEAYTQMLENIDWDRIAYFLKKADSASKEKNKKVTGAGQSALESTVINWYIESSPRGADVYMRIISSTPNVKNTNFKFMGSTPFESTETFDIIGLTYNVSGNVQVEVSCEKKGYVTQKKRFNLRSVIDQKEISTKFNLVKEEE